MNAESSSIPPSAGSDSASSPDRPQRTNLLMSGSIEAEDIAAPVRIRNLSETGALLEGAVLPKVGARLILRRLDLEIGGTVIWADKARCGVKFEGTISVAGWRSGNWIAPAETHDQAHVDSVQAAIRRGAIPLPPSRSPSERLTAPGRGSAQKDSAIHARISDELTTLRHLLQALGEELGEEPVLVERHPHALQRFDLTVQILGHLARVLTAENRDAAIDAIGMESLRERLKHGRGL